MGDTQTEAIDVSRAAGQRHPEWLRIQIVRGSWFPPTPDGMGVLPQPCALHDISQTGVVIVAPTNPAITRGMTIAIETRTRIRLSVQVQTIRTVTAIHLAASELQAWACYLADIDDPTLVEKLLTQP